MKTRPTPQKKKEKQLSAHLSASVVGGPRPKPRAAQMSKLGLLILSFSAPLPLHSLHRSRRCLASCCREPGAGAWRGVVTGLRFRLCPGRQHRASLSGVYCTPLHALAPHVCRERRGAGVQGPGKGGGGGRGSPWLVARAEEGPSWAGLHCHGSCCLELDQQPCSHTKFLTKSSLALAPYSHHVRHQSSPSTRLHSMSRISDSEEAGRREAQAGTRPNIMCPPPLPLFPCRGGAPQGH